MVIDPPARLAGHPRDLACIDQALLALGSIQSRGETIGQTVGKIVEHHIVKHRSGYQPLALLAFALGLLRTGTPALRPAEGSIRKALGHIPTLWEEVRTCLPCWLSPRSAATRVNRQRGEPCGATAGVHRARAVERAEGSC